MGELLIHAAATALQIYNHINAEKPVEPEMVEFATAEIVKGDPDAVPAKKAKKTSARRATAKKPTQEVSRHGEIVPEWAAKLKFTTQGGQGAAASKVNNSPQLKLFRAGAKDVKADVKPVLFEGEAHGLADLKASDKKDLRFTSKVVDKLMQTPLPTAEEIGIAQTKPEKEIKITMGKPVITVEKPSRKTVVLDPFVIRESDLVADLAPRGSLTEAQIMKQTGEDNLAALRKAGPSLKRSDVTRMDSSQRDIPGIRGAILGPLNSHIVGYHRDNTAEFPKRSVETAASRKADRDLDAALAVLDATTPEMVARNQAEEKAIDELMAGIMDETSDTLAKN